MSGYSWGFRIDDGGTGAGARWRNTLSSAPEDPLAAGAGEVAGARRPPLATGRTRAGNGPGSFMPKMLESTNRVSPRPSSLVSHHSGNPENTNGAFCTPW